MSKNPKWEFRDVSLLLQIFRDFLLGRKHTLHPRFPLKVASRSIPQPDIPRSPDIKYSNQYYYARNAFDSVKPPVVAPIAEGPAAGGDPTVKPKVSGVRPDSVCLPGLPIPGTPWAWDGHRYFECVPDVDRRPTCPPPPPPPPREDDSPCAQPAVPPCPLSPDKKRGH
ncbi:unnamed protein product [Diatraea saccharalis]|uniref:NADH dehydrogenase [ubiquinone] 1 alpha subcomplex subunit 7 n=1 Tax=Diatraea saccharalis TaxID=40085 RepID=A0A9N9R790_9NEOP|nr:unnamed protein product [Diatraea saccharalis]